MFITRPVKKWLSSHLSPWRVDCLRPARNSILHLGSAILTGPKSLQVILSFPFFPMPTLTLVDSGFFNYFVDSVFVSRFCLPFQKINLLPFALIDNTINYLVNHVVFLKINFSYLYSCQIEFFVTKLEGTYPIVLGHDWLTQHNPTIDWRKGTIEFLSSNISNSTRSPWPTLNLQNPLSMSYSVPETTSTYLRVEPPITFLTFRCLIEDQTMTNKSSISLVNTAIFVRVCQSEGAISFQVNPYPIIVTGHAAGISEAILEIPGLPEEYKEYGNMFSMQKAKSLSEHWLYDLAIQIEGEKTPLLGPIYSLSTLELKTL